MSGGPVPWRYTLGDCAELQDHEGSDWLGRPTAEENKQLPIPTTTSRHATVGNNGQVCTGFTVQTLTSVIFFLLNIRLNKRELCT